MAVNLNRAYTPEDIRDVVREIAMVWDKPADEIDGFTGADFMKMGRALLEAWDVAERPRDSKLHALFEVTKAGHESWLTREEFEELATWCDVLRDCDASWRWLESFDDADVAASVKEGLQTKHEVTVSRKAHVLMAEYTQGNYGTGVHNGKVVLDNTQLAIYNEAHPGYKTVYQGELPSDASTLLYCLQDTQWMDTYDE